MEHRGRSTRPALRFILTPGQRHDATQTLALMDGMPAAHHLADRAHDAHATLDHVEASGATPIIPQKMGMPRRRAFDPALYKHRNRIERTISSLKQLRRSAARYDCIPANHLDGLYLASRCFWPSMSNQPRTARAARRSPP